MWCGGKTLVFSGMPLDGPLPIFQAPARRGGEDCHVDTTRDNSNGVRWRGIDGRIDDGAYAGIGG